MLQGNRITEMLSLCATNQNGMSAYLHKKDTGTATDVFFGGWPYLVAYSYSETTGDREMLKIDYGAESYTVITGEQAIGESEEDTLEALASGLSFSGMKQTYFTVDATTVFPEGLVTPSELLTMDLSFEKNEKPTILIFHTHGSEGYADSREGTDEDTVIGVGEVLANYLRTAGYTVIHDTTRYDVKDGRVNRDVSYNQALVGLEEHIAEHPEIEVIIDLHRDSGAKRVTEIAGRSTAQVMLFNGLCRNTSGPISYLANENLTGNLAFSLQMKCKGDVLYPGFMKKIYLKGYRYNMHLVPHDLLVEVGTASNTVGEAKAAMKPFSEILLSVLEGK